jgi:hypothetical protein
VVDVLVLVDVSVDDVLSVDEVESVELPSHAYDVPTPNPRHRTSELAPTATFRPRTLCMSDSFRESSGMTVTRRTRHMSFALGRTSRLPPAPATRYRQSHPY